MTRKEEAPAIVVTIQPLPTVDFEDTFSTTNTADTLKEIAEQIFGSPPKWVALLLQLRNFIVRFMGLQYSVPENYHTQFEIGGYINFFKIFDIGDNYLLMGLDDKHLNFRVVIYNDNTPEWNIKVTTLVEYNNKMGQIYMSIVKPFHVWIIQSMIGRAYRKG